MFVCVPFVCLVSAETRRGQQIPRNQSYKWLKATMLVLGTELVPLEKQLSTLNLCPVFPTPPLRFLFFKKLFLRDLNVKSKVLGCLQQHNGV